MSPCRRPLQTLALTLAAALLVACNPPGQRSIIRVEQSGQYYYSIGDYDTAAKEFGEVVHRSPGLWQTRVDLAKSYMKAGKYPEAREQLEIVYTIRPNEPGVLDMLAESMVASGDVDSMAGELRRQAEQRQTVSDWMRLGVFMHKAGDHDSAESALLTAARLDKGRNLGPQLALANMYRDVGETAAALDRYRMALYLKPRDPAIQQSIRDLGAIPGPTYALVPVERNTN